MHPRCETRNQNDVQSQFDIPANTKHVPSGSYMLSHLQMCLNTILLEQVFGSLLILFVRRLNRWRSFELELAKLHLTLRVSTMEEEDWK